MEPQVLFETHVSRPGAATLIGFLAAVPIIFGVMVGMNLFIGDDQLPREIRGSTPWFALGLVTSAGVTAAAWWRSRRRLALVHLAGRQVLEINDNPPVLLEGPFTFRTGWTTVPQPKGPSMTMLQVVFFDGNRVPLVLTEQWGAIYGTPGWDEGVLQGFVAEASYQPAGLSMLVPLVQLLDQAGLEQRAHVDHPRHDEEPGLVAEEGPAPPEDGGQADREA